MGKEIVNTEVLSQIQTGQVQMFGMFSSGLQCIHLPFRTVLSAGCFNIFILMVSELNEPAESK